MADLTRRRFLQASAGVAGAAASITTLGALSTGGLGAALGLSAAETVEAAHSMVAYIPASSRGELRIMVGERAVTATDPELVGRLIRAAG